MEGGLLRAIGDQHNASSGTNLLRCINNPASRVTARSDRIFRYLGIRPTRLGNDCGAGWYRSTTIADDLRHGAASWTDGDFWLAIAAIHRATETISVAQTEPDHGIR